MTHYQTMVLRAKARWQTTLWMRRHRVWTVDGVA